MQPGIYSGISNDDYHGGVGISKSGLDVLARSPMHYWAKYLDPNRERREPTPTMKLGTAIHTAVLEPHEFAARYLTVPDDAPRKPTEAQRNAKKPSDDTVAAIEWWDAFHFMANGREILDAKDYEVCQRISERVRSHPTARAVFADGVAEQSVYWEDPETGVLCKCRPDWLPAGGAMIVDLKSTEDASRDAFMRSAWTYRYWVQAAWYLDGIEIATGQRPEAFVFAAFEKSAPYAPAFYFADNEMIQMGRREYRRLLAIMAECQRTGVWPGYDTAVTPLSLPLWALKAANDNLPTT